VTDGETLSIVNELGLSPEYVILAGFPARSFPSILNVCSPFSVNEITAV